MTSSRPSRASDCDCSLRIHRRRDGLTGLSSVSWSTFLPVKHVLGAQVTRPPASFVSASAHVGCVYWRRGCFSGPTAMISASENRTETTNVTPKRTSGSQTSTHSTSTVRPNSGLDGLWSQESRTSTGRGYGRVADCSPDGLLAALLSSLLWFKSFTASDEDCPSFALRNPVYKSHAHGA